MERFNPKRFWRLCRLRYAENRRTLVLIMLLSMMGLLVDRVLCMAGVFVSGDMVDRLSRIDKGSMIIGTIALVYVMQLFVDAVQRRETGIRFFMLPATNLERYVLLVVEPLVCFFVLWLVAWCGAELIWRLCLYYMFPDIYAIYLGIDKVGQSIYVLFYVAVILFSGIFMPFKILTNEHGKMVSIVLFVILLVAAILVPLLIFVALIETIHSGVVVAVVWGAILLVVAVVIHNKAYDRFCEYEVNLKVEEK